MSWDIVYTAGARRDLRDIYEYIVYELLVPETAAGQTQRIMKGIRVLDEMPMRFRLYEEEPWRSEELWFSLLIITLCFICRVKPKIQ